MPPLPPPLLNAPLAPPPPLLLNAALSVKCTQPALFLHRATCSISGGNTSMTLDMLVLGRCPTTAIMPFFTVTANDPLSCADHTHSHLSSSPMLYSDPNCTVNVCRCCTLSHVSSKCGTCRCCTLSHVSSKCGTCRCCNLSHVSSSIYIHAHYFSWSTANHRKKTIHVTQ